MEEEIEDTNIVPFVFHNIDLKKENMENSKAELKSILENVDDKEIQSALIELVSFDEKIQVKAADKILSWAMKYMCNGKLFRAIYSIKTFYESLPYRILENRAAKYFIDLFGLSGPHQVAFLEKTDGIQLGRKILITLPCFETRAFYIKTHRSGSKSDSGIRIKEKSVDLKELLVYSTLQCLQLGPEIHYFWEDSIRFYIASADLKEIGRFKEYKKICKNLPDPEITPILDPIHLQICKELVKLDLISRIFHLSDTIDNKGNFGFVEKNGCYDLRLIDFSFKDDYCYVGERLFQGFLSDWGTFYYHGSNNPTVLYALRGSKIEERCQIAVDFLRDFNFKEALEEGYQRVSNISTILEIPLEDLQEYYKSTKKSIKMIEKRLKLDN